MVGSRLPWYGTHKEHVRPDPQMVLCNDTHIVLIFGCTDGNCNGDYFMFAIPKLGRQYAEADEAACRFFKFMPRVDDNRYNFHGHLLHKGCVLMMEREFYERLDNRDEDHKTFDDMCGKWNVRMMDFSSNRDLALLLNPDKVAIAGGLQHLSDNMIPFLSIFGDWLLNMQDYEYGDDQLLIQFIAYRNSTPEFIEESYRMRFPYEDIIPHEGYKYDYYIRQNAIRWLGFHVRPINLI